MICHLVKLLTINTHLHPTNCNNIRNICDHIVCEKPVRRPLPHFYIWIYLLLIARYHHVGASWIHTLHCQWIHLNDDMLTYGIRLLIHQPVLMSVNSVFLEQYNTVRRKLIIGIFITEFQCSLPHHVGSYISCFINKKNLFECILLSNAVL